MAVIEGQGNTLRNKKKKKKERARRRREEEAAAAQAKQADTQQSAKEPENPPEEVIYVPDTPYDQPLYHHFSRIFELFRISEPEKSPEPQPQEEKQQANAAEFPKKELNLKKVPKLPDEFDDEDEHGKGDDKKEKISKRKMKKLTRLSVAELKQLVSRPDVVEMHDVTARDPKLLVLLKGHRNTVPVPRHWCFKRKYLQGKRGIEKPPFDLPDFIKKTGIMEMRESLQEKDDQKTLKAKMRERARPKMGKIDIDYQKLHDAFFKWQTKPRLTIHGDLYYEGKEYETRLREKKPGDLSDELRTALGMPIGPSAHKVPPPWLIAMQRYGPPPSYPNLKIPGLNAPIPEGCSFGYHAGGWGKPPVDENGKPLYGDVFGVQNSNDEKAEGDEDIDQTAWGELESESEEESEEEEEEEEEKQADDSGLVTPAEGLITPSGITSIPAGLETPEIIELRKRKIESEMEGGETPALYQVLAEKKMDRVGGAMMASTHTYEIPSLPSSIPNTGAVELALDPSELDLVDTDAMAVRYEQQMKEQQSQLQKEDLSDMLADHVSRSKRKRKVPQAQDTKQTTKKYKEFKF
nr:PREDICTED: splicing factor 3B subunit 2 [Bemisia tabaci]